MAPRAGDLGRALDSGIRISDHLIDHLIEELRQPAGRAGPRDQHHGDGRGSQDRPTRTRPWSVLRRVGAPAGRARNHRLYRNSIVHLLASADRLHGGEEDRDHREEEERGEDEEDEREEHLDRCGASSFHHGGPSRLANRGRELRGRLLERGTERLGTGEHRDGTAKIGQVESLRERGELVAPACPEVDRTETPRISSASGPRSPSVARRSASGAASPADEPAASRSKQLRDLGVDGAQVSPLRTPGREPSNDHDRHEHTGRTNGSGIGSRSIGTNASEMATTLAFVDRRRSRGDRRDGWMPGTVDEEGASMGFGSRLPTPPFAKDIAPAHANTADAITRT